MEITKVPDAAVDTFDFIGRGKRYTLYIHGEWHIRHRSTVHRAWSVAEHRSEDFFLFFSTKHMLMLNACDCSSDSWNALHAYSPVIGFLPHYLSSHFGVSVWLARWLLFACCCFRYPLWHSRIRFCLLFIYKLCFRYQLGSHSIHIRFAGALSACVGVEEIIFQLFFGHLTRCGCNKRVLVPTVCVCVLVRSRQHGNL